MKMKTIKKSITLNAPPEKVWDVIVNNSINRVWYEAFHGGGTQTDTDWKVGSKAIFADNSKSGMISTVVANTPCEYLSVEYQGQLVQGKEDYTSSDAKAIKGGKETYHLSVANGSTKLSIESDTGEEFFEQMSRDWDDALSKIKDLAEE